MDSQHCVLENVAIRYDTIALDLLKKEEEELEERRRRMPNRHFFIHAVGT